MTNPIDEMQRNPKVAAAFVKAQTQFAPALKTATNPHFRSKYADLSACVEAVMDALNNNGIGLIQRTHESESGVNVETVMIHESGESLSAGILHVPAAKNDPQGYGSALTYARRYSLMAACGIAPEDDDGNAASKAQRQPAKPAGMTDDQTRQIFDLCNQAGKSPADLTAFFGVERVADIPSDKFDGIIKTLNRRIAEQTTEDDENGEG